MNATRAYFACCLLSAITCRSRAVESTPPPGNASVASSARAPAHAGSWYPGGQSELRRAITQLLDRHSPATGTAPIVAIVGPHAGLRWSGHVAAAAYKKLAGQTVRRAFVLGPTHHVSFDGIALPAEGMDVYATPLGDLRFDLDALRSLWGLPGFRGPARAHLPEHSLEMHAIFLAAVHPDARLVPLVVGRVGDGTAARNLADAIRSLLRPDDVVIISSDFTHYGARFGYVPFQDDVPGKLMATMDRALERLEARSVDGFGSYLAETHDTICGREPIKLLLALLPEGVRAKEVARDTSGHMTRDFSSSVSYLSIIWRRKDGWPETFGTRTHRFQQGRPVLDTNQQALALTMIRKTLDAYLNEGRTPNDDDLNVPATGPFRDTLSVFVTLKKHGQLRGCIGHITPTQALWRDIRDNAISAAVRDTRFPPVSAEELSELHVEVSVLTPPQRIPGPEAFVVGHHGIIVSSLGRRAVYLPQVAPEQGWDRDTTLTNLSRKAGLPGDAWRGESAQLEVFEAQVFSEPE